MKDIRYLLKLGSLGSSLWNEDYGLILDVSVVEKKPCGVYSKPHKNNHNLGTLTSRAKSSAEILFHWKNSSWEFTCGLVVRIWAFIAGIWVQSLVRELRVHKLCGTVQKKKKSSSWMLLISNSKWASDYGTWINHPARADYHELCSVTLFET